MYKEKKVVAIVLAAGKGTRIGFDKMLYKIGESSVVYKAVLAFEKNEYIDEIIVTASENIDEIKKELQGFKKIKSIIKGGKTRPESVYFALDKTDKDTIVAIHDGARPFVSDIVIKNVVEDAYKYKAAIPCVKVKDTIKIVDGDFLKSTPNRENLYIAQTPQIFCTNLYKKLLLENKNLEYTDDAQLFENANIPVKISKGDYENYKITTIDDIK